MKKIPTQHRSIYKKALFIDQLIDYYKHARKRSNFPHRIIEQVIHLLFPSSHHLGRGFFKTVHYIPSRAKDLAIKTASTKSIRSDMRVYKRLPKNIRNRYFAKIYWNTKYCILQKYGKKVRVPEKDILKLKRVAKKYGLTDVRQDNIRKIDGVFKIIDANLRK